MRLELSTVSVFTAGISHYRPWFSSALNGISADSSRRRRTCAGPNAVNCRSKSGKYQVPFGIKTGAIGVEVAAQARLWDGVRPSSDASSGAAVSKDSGSSVKSPALVYLDVAAPEDG